MLMKELENTEYLDADEYNHLIGKVAKLLPVAEYDKKLYGVKGKIVVSDGIEKGNPMIVDTHTNLYFVYDEYIKDNNGDDNVGIYLVKDGFEIINK